MTTPTPLPLLPVLSYKQRSVPDKDTLNVLNKIQKGNYSLLSMCSGKKKKKETQRQERLCY